MKINTILQAIGDTPVVRLNKLFPDHHVWMKLEKSNPGGSIKDRIALAMIEDAENKGRLTANTHIIEPTSGNTGVALAMICAVKGYKLTLVMPESMSIERRVLMQSYGAELVLTPKEKGMKGAIDKVSELIESNSDSWMPSQFTNEANTNIHRETTALEIEQDFPEGIDFLITGVGTGGHITGIAERLKKRTPNLKVMAVEPEASPVISGGKPAPHPLQGIGAGFVPQILNTAILDNVIKVNKDESFEEVRKLAATEGILAGISTGASLAAVRKELVNIDSEATVLTFNYDTGERYISVDGLLLD